jgi:hypothetical protein
MVEFYGRNEAINVLIIFGCSRFSTVKVQIPVYDIIHNLLVGG